jgi:hypothetical protein
MAFRKSNKVIILLFAIICSLYSCKKDNENTTSNLLNSKWCGEFVYSKTAPDTRMVFSLIFYAETQVAWYDITGKYDGTWKKEGDMVLIEFPSGRVEAKFSDSKLENLTFPAGQDWQVKYLYQSAMPEESVLYSNIYKGETLTGPFQINFSVNNVNFKPLNTNYRALYFGAGIISSQENVTPGGVSYFIFPYSNAVFYNSTIGAIGSINMTYPIFYNSALKN